MHEMSLCEGIVQILEDQARAQQYSKVKTVWVEIGSLAHVDPDALLFSYDLVCKNTLAEGSTLEIIHQPATAWCMQCAENISIEQRYDPCPKCGGHQLQVTSGDDMRIKELEVE